MAGRYRIVGVIGRGGMGEVYRATDQVLGRDVAVKLMLPVPGTLAASERFLREARATARIHDPHVVAAYDFGDHDGCCYLAMELVSGRSVGDELRREGPFAPDRAVHIVRQAAAGLAAAHRLGIVHRDIKPGNLLLADDGTVKVADFGIVRFLEDYTTTLTSTGQIVGTSHFLAPERALGRPAEPPSDVYALGCVLYQLVTGHPPFLADEPASIMFQHVRREPVPPSELRPELAGDVEALLLWMLTKDPAERPTAAQVTDGARPPVPGVLPVRRAVARPVRAGVVAGLALMLSATVGIVFATRDVKLPTTNDLSPTDSRTTPPSAVPTTTSRPPSPAPTQTVTQTTTLRPVPRSGPSKPKPPDPGSTGRPKDDKPGQDKPKKPKP
ncbi:serine/threonine protein kinase [Kribbella capetownensis]|uniref:non-specific serine/threonine protein kinase n=1 Tax=Kribbella capetownensis TaxID=1572659 RepID=A0A4R0JDQ5_9ACTN|nr:serine/threonine protein kinase [Kribbella capetownensis]